MSTPKPPAFLTFSRWPLRVRVGLSLGAGILASLAFPPASLRPVAFFTLVPFLLALRGATARDGAVAGAAFGMAFIGVLIGWISLVGWIAWGALVLLQLLFFAGFGALAALLGRGGVIARVLGWPMLWTGIELARSRVPFGGFAWGVMGSSQESASPLTPLARAGGVLAISVALALINVLLAEAISARRKRGASVAVVLAAAAAVGPAWMPIGAVQTTGSIDVAMVQGNVPEGYFAGLRRGRVGPEDEIIIRNHLRLTDTLAADPPDLVIWPENALDRDPTTDPVAGQAVADAIAATGAPLLVGAIMDGPDADHFANANLLYDRDGTLIGRYDKIGLVPFGEYVPWGWTRRVVPALAQIGSDGIPGTKPVVLEHPDGVRIGAVICFESSRSELVRQFAAAGAEMIVVTTNNATFGRSPLARQHLAQSRMRAVETGRPVLHAAISGISAIIAPDGSVVRQAGLFIPGILRQTIVTTGGQTPFVAYGPQIEGGYAIAAGLAALLALLFVRRGARAAGIDEDEDDGEFWLAPLRHDDEPITQQLAAVPPDAGDPSVLSSRPVAAEPQAAPITTPPPPGEHAVSSDPPGPSAPGAEASG